MTESQFLVKVIQRNTDPVTGQEKDQFLLARMQHPICVDCQKRYKEKYPGAPFDVVCKGIFGDEDYERIAKKTGDPVEDVKAVLDVCEWAHQNVEIPDENGDLVPFTPRGYQETALKCTATRQVDRWGRGLGKTICGGVKELHKALSKRHYKILVICPGKSQSEMWWEMFDEIISRNDELNRSVVSRKQQPYYRIGFSNGSQIAIFTAGSQAGRKGGTIRGFSPRRVRADEQDMLTDGDYKAIMPLLRRYRDSEFQGSSTPTGAREMFWKMCKEFKDYQEFHFPITHHPEYNQDYAQACRREALTEVNFLHEYMAEFGDQEGGVFKAIYVDLAKQAYLYSKQKYNPRMRYFMGVDWNGQGTGTRIRVVSFDPETKKRSVVASLMVNTTTQDSIEAIRQLNQRWHCEEIYIDNGFGHVQDELLRLVGANARNADDKRLRDIKVIDFGASMKTNRLVPQRGYEKYRQAQELERRTKPFMVEGAVMCFEQGLFEFSGEDHVLDGQLRAYRVKTWSAHGYANVYACGNAGDHDLDAIMLALLGIELKYGLFATPHHARTAILSHLAGFGVPELDEVLPPVKEKEDDNLPEAKREIIRRLRGVPARSPESGDLGPPAQVVLAGRGSYMVRPGLQSPGGRTSRLPRAGFGRGLLGQQPATPDWISPGARFLGRRPY